MEIQKNKLFLISLGLILAVGVILRLELYFANLSFFFDETLLALNIHKLGYREFFTVLDNVQIAPALFMMISKFLYTIFGVENNIIKRDLVLRIAPLITGILTPFIVSLFVHKAFKNNYITVFSTAIVSFNTAAINYSQEFKQYSSDLFFASLLLYAFYTIDFKNFTPIKLGLYSIFFCFALWSSYSSVILLVTGLLMVLYEIIKYKIFDIKKIIFFFTPVICCSISFYAHITKVSEKYFELMQWHWTYIERSFLTLENFIYMFPYKTQKLFPFIKEDFILFVLIIGILILLWKARKKTVYLTLAPIFLSIILSMFKRYPYEQRLILFLLPNFAIILSQLLYLLKPAKLKNIVIYTIFIIISLFQFKTPVIEKDLNYSNAREYSQILINEKVKEENLLAISSVSKYYLLPYFKKEIHAYHDIWKGFNKESFEKELNKMPYNQTLWLLCPREMPDYYDDTFSEIKKYMENNKNIKIQDIIETKKDKSYLIKFKRINMV